MATPLYSKKVRLNNYFYGMYENINYTMLGFILGLHKKRGETRICLCFLFSKMTQAFVENPHLVRQIQLHSQGDPPYPADNGECRALLSRLLLFVLRFGFLPLENEEFDDQNLFPGGEPGREEGGGEGERRRAGGQDGEAFLNCIFDAFFTI